METDAPLPGPHAAEPRGAGEERDRAHMQAALSLARRGLGAVWPNPAVGCVIARDGRVIGRGWTQPGGRPHAETEALLRAGAAACGATAYVTLEPCSHWGWTPPCADALIAARIGRVVVALEDPDPRVSGRGLRRLAAAGIAVETGLCAKEAEQINAGFLSRIRRSRPLVALKLATTLDGRIATASGESRWITGPAARARAHLLRARHDAVMIGSGTVLADDPALTCRLPGLEGRSPVRVVLDARLRTPPGAHLIAAARLAPTWLLTVPEADPERRARLADRGVLVIDAPPDPAGGLDLEAALKTLGERGLTRVLVEGGAQLAASLLRAGLVDRLYWFHAPRAIGGDGVPAIAMLGFAQLAEAPSFERVAVEAVGEDVLTVLRAGT